MGRESLFRIMKGKLKGSIKQYLKAKDELSAVDDIPMFTEEQQAYLALLRKERLLRGVVRGQAMMLLVFMRPSQHTIKDEVEDVEQEFGFPHDRPRARASTNMQRFLKEYYDS